MSNPFVCDCRIKWLRNWLIKSNLATGNPKCSQPDSLKGRSIASLDEQNFAKCPVFMASNGCSVKNDIGDKVILKSSNNVCPVNCTCVGMVVRCSRSFLKSIPEGIPTNVQELYANCLLIN